MTTPDMGAAILIVIAMWAVVYAGRWVGERRRVVAERRRRRSSSF